MTTVSWRRDRLFYVSMSIAAVAAVLAGFSRTYYARPLYQTSSLPPYLHVHGLVFSTWIALFAVQIGLVATRRLDRHRRLGWAGAGLAVLMVPVALTAAVFSGRREVTAGHVDAALTFFAVPVFSMIVFVVLVGSAVYWRRRPETHKRLMLLATVSILDAAVARWPIALVATTTWGYYALTDLFILSAILFDMISRRRVAAAYVWGGLLVVSAQFAREIVGPTAVWHAFARSVVG